MADFAVSFTASQTIDGKTLTYTDTSNYGADGGHHKTDFSGRQLKVIRGDDTTNTTVYDWPYTNTDDSTQDTFSIDITQDYAYSVTLVLTETGGTIDQTNNPVLTSQFVELNKLKMLNRIQPCDCNDRTLLDYIDKVNIALISATQKASVGDISGSNQVLQYAYETTKLFV
jgi:hypothetical protein